MTGTTSGLQLHLFESNFIYHFNNLCDIDIRGQHYIEMHKHFFFYRDFSSHEGLYHANESMKKQAYRSIS